MTALDAERLRKARTGDDVNLAVKAGAQIYRGGIVVAIAGIAVAGRAATTRAELLTMLVQGLAVDSALGGAADGDVRVEIEKGDVYCLANAGGGDALTIADIDQLCFVVDDQTVGKTTGGGLRPIAGKVVDVDPAGVWVDFAYAREPRRLFLEYFISETDTLAGTSAELICPVTGAVTQNQVIVQKAVTTGGDVTVNVGATPVTGLTNTVADAAAKGTIVTDVPTPGHATTVVAAGGRLQVVPAAAFATAGAISGVLEITY